MAGALKSTAGGDSVLMRHFGENGLWWSHDAATRPCLSGARLRIMFCPWHEEQSFSGLRYTVEYVLAINSGELKVL